jgi:hypothetical protein
MIDDQNATPRSLAAIHMKLSVALLFVFVCTCTAIDNSAHNAWLAEALQGTEYVRCESKGYLVPYTLGFIDAGDRLMLGDIPELDTSTGGVYVFGASVAIHCLDDWRLPPEQSRLIHNFGVYSANPTQTLHLIRFLTEQHSLFSAGGQRSLVFLGLAFTDMIEPNQDFEIGGARYLPACVQRSGLYDYDPQAGISPIPMCPLMWQLTYEKARSRSFLLRCLFNPDVSPPENVDAAQFRRNLIIHMGPNWDEVMARQMSKLGEILDYLQARHVNVVPFFVPHGSWMNGLPESDRFVAAAQSLCAARQIPLLDYSHLLKDEEFCDPSHPTGDGTRKVQALLMKTAVDFLHRTGALAPESGDSSDAQ